jgi:beta-carotene hydroxylase
MHGCQVVHLAAHKREEAMNVHRRLGFPTLAELGLDLRTVPLWRRLFCLALPFACCGAYFGFAAWGWWPAAVLAVVALSFFTYGSTSHDLVHRNLGLPAAVNDVLLCLIELLALRSGHAYQAAHLHHHARFPHPDDVEATAAGKSWAGAIAEGPGSQLRLFLWAARNGHARGWIYFEGVACLALLALAVGLWPITPAPAVYAALVILGSWPIPLVTSRVPHDPRGKDVLSQTRAFRGVVASVVALEHLYHLEHHLYPAVPHQRWRELARRLDPYLERAGVKPIKLWF